MIYDKNILSFPPDIQGDEDWNIFADLMDQLDNQVLSAIRSMTFFWDIERVPDDFLFFVAYANGAPIFRSDSVLSRRRKIRDAISKHKTKTTRESLIYWIQEITGVTPLFDVDLTTSRNFIWESLNDPMSEKFAKWQRIADTPYNGMMWGTLADSGTSDRFIVYVDLVLTNLTGLQLDRLKRIFEYFGSAYIRYRLGYRNPTWVEYGVIN